MSVHAKGLKGYSTGEVGGMHQDVRDMLRWFYLLEVNQVALYKAQAAMAQHELDRRMFLKAAEIESTHVRNMRTALAGYGAEPGPLSPVAKLTGGSLGVLTGISLWVALKGDIALENRAMADYQRAITACRDRNLLRVLWSNYLDESLHTEWFKSRLRRSLDQVLIGSEGRKRPRLEGPLA